MKDFDVITEYVKELYGTREFIPLHVPKFRGKEKDYLERCIDTTFVSSVGKFVDQFEDQMTQISGTLFPVITNEKVNLYLKEIAEAVGLKKNLTFHMARHTFATTVTLSNGVPIETVSKLLGHSKIASTQIYARVIERKVSEDMQLLKMKLETDTVSLNKVNQHN